MIELKVDKFKKGIVTFHISHQDEEDYEILREGFYRNIKDTEYELRSLLYPAYHHQGKEVILFVRGVKDIFDELTMECLLEIYLDLLTLIKEYNKVIEMKGEKDV